ncbi:hypothetical protein Naga_100024g46 [Nannochloropsis gaditana]|uniref:Uncharacterized protein n=1 Tax=Nannochloropsis gaditana TaxID=72520 RepID=W7U824_9STRA|nr:hypothetical protein Naga_100024g46 [Nannochloropsis gaditana]
MGLGVLLVYVIVDRFCQYPGSKVVYNLYAIHVVNSVLVSKFDADRRSNSTKTPLLLRQVKNPNVLTVERSIKAVSNL